MPLAKVSEESLMHPVDKAYEKQMLKKLAEFGFEPHKLIGAPFIFGEISMKDGLHIIGGSVTSFGCTDKEGLRLYVTTPRFLGMDIKRFEKRGDNWVAVSSKGEEISGAFIFLAPLNQ